MPDETTLNDTGPIEFAEKILGIHCWDKMREIMQAVADGHRKILVRSCNGAGKTTAIAAICNWKLSKYPDSIVLTTASSWTQVRRTLWGEIRKQARQGQLYQGTKLAQTSIPIDDKHYALGISPSVPENAQGFHAPHMLIAIDEATGVDREIVDALSGNLTNVNAQMLLICNPINTQSYPYEAEQTGDWKLITISAFEHPNVETGVELIRGAVTREWIEDRLRSWSYEVEAPEEINNEELRINRETDERDFPPPINSSLLIINLPKAIYVGWLEKWFAKTPIVASRILGEWADNDAEGFITADLVERAIREKVGLEAPTYASTKSLGVDVARGGDDTVFAMFEGDVQLPFEVFHHSDLMRTANKIKLKFDEGFEIVTVDDTGIGGGVTDRLKELGVPVIAVNFNQKARGFLRHKKDLANARAEMYFLVEEELKDGTIRILDDKLLHQELTAVRLTTVANSTAFKMEDKELTRRRLGRSPDRADATALARYGLKLKKLEKLKFM